ncbi:MAG: hypothetical protein ABI232_06025, partial [Jatrophihabitantaceae bacterium]
MSHYEREPRVDPGPRRRPSPAATHDDELDPNTLLFGDDDHQPGPPLSRSERRQAESKAVNHRRNRRSRRVFIVMAVVIVLVVGITAAVVVPKLSDWFGTPDYAGSGTG